MSKIPYKPFWDNLHVPIYAKDPSQNFTYVIWNEACAKLFGKCSQDIIGKTDFEIFSRSLAESKRKFDEYIMLEKKPLLNFKEKIKTADGLEVLVKAQRMLHFNENGEVDILINVLEDITQQNQKNGQIKFVLQKTRMGFWDFNLKTNELTWDEALYELYEIPQGQHITLNLWLSLVDADDHMVLEKKMQKSMHENVPFEGLFRFYSPTKGVRWISTVAYFELDSHGQKVRMLGLNRDETEHIQLVESLKKNELALKSLQETNQVALSTAGLGVWEWDLNTNRLMWDQKMFELFGVDPKTTVTFNTFAKALIAEDLIAISKDIKICIEEHLPIDIEFQITHPLKGVRLIKGDGKVIYDENNHAHKIIGLNQDITEKRQLELDYEIQQKKLLNNSHLSSLGEIASSIAHEINNPLTIMSGMASLIARLLDDPIGNKKLILGKLEKIVSTVERTAKIVKSMKALSQSHSDESLEMIDLYKMVEEARVLLKDFLMKKEVDFINNIPQDFPLIEICPNQLIQVIINLVTNAADAVFGQEKKWIKISLNLNSKIDECQILIEDSGPKIPQETAKKMMQPFFTTKTHTNTGLGLSISKSMIESHGGELTYLNLEKKLVHTTFLIKIPRGQSLNQKQNLNRLRSIA